MKNKYTLAKWLALHTVALTVVLVLTILFPLESCWKNYNYNILPVDKKQKTTGSSLSGQKQTQDIDSETEDLDAASNLMPTDIIEGTPAQVNQIDQSSQGTSIASAEGTSDLALSGASNSVISKETQIGKQQLVPNGNSKIQAKTLQAEQIGPDNQKQVKERLLEEKEKVEEIKDSEVKETKVKQGGTKEDKVNKPKITKVRRRRCRKRGLRK